MARTVATNASVDAYIAALPDAERRDDCATLIEMMSRVTGHPARMWGPGIVGFDRHAYSYDSGHPGESCKHKMGKSCLSVRRLANIDLGVLEQLVAESVRETRARYGGAQA